MEPSTGSSHHALLQSGAREKVVIPSPMPRDSSGKQKVFWELGAKESLRATGAVTMSRVVQKGVVPLNLEERTSQFDPICV